MLRIVLDTNVYVAGLLAPDGACAEVLAALSDARFEAVICPRLREELAGVLARDRFAAWVSSEDIADFLKWLERSALAVADPTQVEPVSPDPSDDYLVALAVSSGAAALVSGDAHLLGLRLTRPRTLTVAAFAAVLRELP